MKRMIVLDANILFRAILGVGVPRILEAHADTITYISPDYCYFELSEHVPEILQKKLDISIQDAEKIFYDKLSLLQSIVYPVPEDAYIGQEHEAKRRIREVDEDDWHSVALALTVDCPIWTEDRDYFGIGIATWRTKFIETYINQV